MANVLAKHLRVELRVELDSPGVPSEAYGVVGVHEAGRKTDRARRHPKNGLGVTGLGRQTRRQVPQQGIGPGFRFEPERHGPELTAFRVVRDIAAQRVRQELMAVAYPEDGRPQADLLRQPGRRTVAPVPMVRDHRVGTGDRYGGVSLVLRQPLPCFYIHYVRLGRSRPHPAEDPVLEISAAASKGRHGAPGLDDQDPAPAVYHA